MHISIGICWAPFYESLKKDLLCSLLVENGNPKSQTNSHQHRCKSGIKQVPLTPENSLNPICKPQGIRLTDPSETSDLQLKKPA